MCIKYFGIIEKKEYSLVIDFFKENESRLASFTCTAACSDASWKLKEAGVGTGLIISSIHCLIHTNIYK